MRHKDFLPLVFFILVLNILFVPPGLTVLHAENKPASSPIHIEADRLESNPKDNTVLFSGHVEAKQADITIHADEMTVHYLTAGNDTSGPVSNAQRIKKLFARGNVKITRGDWIASGDTVEYFEKEKKVLLNGHTQVWENNNMVTGESITLYLDEGKSVVERGDNEGGRVKAFFYPPSTEK